MADLLNAARVGQVGNLRPIVNRPGAGSCKILRPCRQPGKWVSGEKILKRMRGAIANRPQVNNLPYTNSNGSLIK
jgi:hypothetical protein